MILALTSDSLTLRKLAGIADVTGMEVIQGEAATMEADTETAPTAIIVPIGQTGWQTATARCKERWPRALVVGVLAIPDAELWSTAETSGCDIVTTRGALGRALPERLRSWLESGGKRKRRLFALSDVAGRLGLVLRTEDDFGHPVAVYHIGNDIVAVEDLCPHAGAMLSHGEIGVDDGIVTCPEHGSRFDTRSGDRVRGPADEGLKTFPVVVEDGQAYMSLE